MTVGLAALARGGKAIVMMADRRMTYGEGELHSEMWTHKLLEVENGWHVLFAGNPTLAEAVVGNARNNRDIMPVVPKLGRALQRTYETEIDRTILMPRLLNRELYLARKSDLQPLPETYREQVDAEVTNFHLDCVLLACGYEDRRAGIITLLPFTMTHAYEGFAAIGSGARAALSAMVFAQLDPRDDIDVQLFQLLYAKSHAEDTAFVGYEMDAWILTPDKLTKVDSDIVGHEDALLDRVLEEATQLPFDHRPEWEQRPGWKRARPAPKGWEKKLKDYVDSVAEKVR